MLRQVLIHFPYLNLVIVGQLLFLAIFMGVLVWVFRKGSSRFYDQLARLPLEGDQK